MSALASIPQSLRRYLGDFVFRVRVVHLSAAILRALAALAGWIVLCALADRWLSLDGRMRAVLLAGQGAIAVALLAGPIRRLARPIDWVAAAWAVEQHDPSLGQRLITVTSQCLAPAELRSSAQFVQVLAEELQIQLRGARSTSLVRWTLVRRPALWLGGVMLFAAGLWAWPNLDFPQLLRRQYLPLANLEAVTTTRIDCPLHGVVMWPEKMPLEVRATVRHLNTTALPVLQTSTEGDKWEGTPMSPLSGDTYGLVLPAPEQDLLVRIQAGDARTVPAQVRVKRRPQLAELRVRYTYPSYTGRAPLTVHAAEGLIEAPQGSEALVIVSSTEPLTWGRLKTGEQVSELTPTADPRVWQARLTIIRDQSADLEMISDRDVYNRHPTPLQIRSVTDRAPLVRLLQPAADLRLSPREMVPLSFLAMDDYGLSQLVVTAHVNGVEAGEFPQKIKGDARRVEGSFVLDLATLRIKIGDVVTIGLRGIDKAGQKSLAEPRQVLIAPRSIDVTMHRRILELAQAASAARQWHETLERVRRDYDLARRTQGESTRLAAMSKVSRQLLAAVEGATLARQSLLRTIGLGASPRLADTLAVGLDALVRQIDDIERAAREFPPVAAAEAGIDQRLSRAFNSAGEMSRNLRKLADGEQAQAVLADRVNLKAATGTKSASDARRQLLERTRQEVNGGLNLLGIPTGSGAVDAQLQQRIDAATGIMMSQGPIDWRSVSEEWCREVLAKRPGPHPLDERLYTAAQAAAMRNDADLVVAHDLMLAARAAAVLADQSTATSEAARGNSARQRLSEFGRLVSALHAQHELLRRAAAASSVTEARKVFFAGFRASAAGGLARTKLALWGAGPGAVPDEIAARVREIEELAMSANAATATRDFDKAAELDRKLAATLNKPELANASAGPRAISQLLASQESVVIEGETEAATQRRIASAIAQAADAASMEQTDSRQAATAAITLGQERLASLPLHLTRVQQHWSALAETASRLSAARAEAVTAPAIRKEEADRQVEQLQKDWVDAREAVENAARPLQRGGVEEWLEPLRSFAPETSTGVSAVDEQLLPALEHVRKAIDGTTEQSTELDIAAQEARQAIRQAQDALRQAQRQIMERDPLVAARWFASAAGDAIAAGPASRRSAAANQQHTLEALHAAGLDALRQSKVARLSNVPTFAPLYLPLGSDTDPRLSADRLLSSVPSLREWTRLRPRSSDSLIAPAREPDPPAYAESLRIYFQVLNHAESSPRSK